MMTQTQIRKAIADQLNPTRRGVSGIPEIAKAYQNDPRTQLAVQSMANGSSGAPVAQGKYAYMDGIARALQGGLGGMADRQQQAQYGNATDARVAADKGMGAAGRGLTPLDPVAIAQGASPAGATPLPAIVPPPPPQPAPAAIQGGQPGGGQGPFPASPPSRGGFDLTSGANALKANGATITSGYRTPAKNAQVHGVADSYHMKGTPDNPQALDFTPKPGQTMAALEAQARAAFPGYDVLNEGNHVHVEPSKAMARGGANVPLPDKGPVSAFTPPVAADVPDLPKPLARPTAPQAVAAGKSPLLQAAYDLMLHGNEWTSTQANRMYEGGLAEQNDLNEGALTREQALRNTGYQADLGQYADSQNSDRAAKVADRTRVSTDNFKDQNDYVAWLRKLEEDRRNNAARIQEAGMRADAIGNKVKPLSATAVDKLTKTASALDTVNMLGATFKDRFVGRPVFGGTGIAVNKVIGGDQELGQWWQNYQGWIADIRKMYFGSAFTPNEQRQFDKFVITPAMDAKLAKQNIQRQQGLTETALGRTSRALSAEYNSDAVREAIGRDPASLGVAKPTAPPASGGGWGKATVVGN